jgi:hypothetical protein
MRDLFIGLMIASAILVFFALVLSYTDDEPADETDEEWADRQW